MREKAELAKRADKKIDHISTEVLALPERKEHLVKKQTPILTISYTMRKIQTSSLQF
jgi:hypothetical protein